MDTQLERLVEESEVIDLEQFENKVMRCACKASDDNPWPT